MADVRLLIQEEGRAARNLIAFNVPVGTNSTEKVTKKPPSVPRVMHTGSLKRPMKPVTRVRSASTGRDKKSELQARYWAFLFGNLQRAVDGIYQTCEEDENISECKEVILVLENYTRDFHNLIEWFKVKWAYENSPPPLRRTPLAWEVRKTSPCRIWNPTMIPKSTSPLQRLSPTESICRSPVDQMICENKGLDNKMNHIKEEESVQKMIKESKNNVSKNGSSTCIRERCKNLCDSKGTNKDKVTAAKVVNKSATKQTGYTKGNGLVHDAKETSPREIRNKWDAKSTLKQSKNILSNGITKTNTYLSVEKSREALCNEKNAQLNGHSNQEAEKEFSKNVNPQVKSAPIQNKVANQTSRKQLGSSVNNALGKSASSMSLVGVASKGTPNVSKPAYSAVSQTKTARSKQSSLPETPRFTRSKTTLCDKSTTPPNKTRPGTSVIVRQRLQPLENKIAEQNNSLRKEQNRDLNGSVEVLTKQTIVKPKDESDGWQTVRSRYRRGSTHNLNMSTRFHKPSMATSLPALSIDSPSEKTKKNCLTPDGNGKQKKRQLAGKAGKNMNNEVEKVKRDPNLTSIDINDFEDTPKRNIINLSEINSTSVIAAIFKSDADLLEKRIKQFMAAQAERERIILEEERKTEEADSQRSQQLSDEEAMLTRQILELESADIDIDTETDETDGELVLEMEDDPSSSLNTVSDDLSLEDRYENVLEGMSWAERVDTLAQLRALVARHPGRALELHQKLSSPSRKRSLPETLRRYQAKQACAEYKRQKLLMEKSQRLRDLLNKVEDVKSAKTQLIEDKRMRMEMRLKRAEENRTQHLLEVVRKAHDEDSKLKEIAFINELEAQNKRHDFMALCQEQEERLQGIHEERQRRQEEKAAKEAAAEERRRVLEAERQLRIQKMKQARREREERVGKMQLEREKERQELAREKARDREERLSALHAAQLANQEELQKKIAQKQQESARRHVENIEHIRQRAVESSILRSEEVPPTLKSYPAQKQCSLCGTIIPNEVQLLSHLKGKTHLEAVRNTHDGREPSRDELQRFNILQIRDLLPTANNNNNTSDAKLAREKQKALKRRCRKMKQRMTQRGEEWEESHKNDESQAVDSTNKAKFRRNLKKLDRLYSAYSKAAWTCVPAAALERCLGEITRAFSKACPFDQNAFRGLNGFDILSNLLHLGLQATNPSQTLPNKSILSLCRVYKSSVVANPANVEAILLSNKVVVIVDLLLQRFENLTNLDDQSQVQESSSASTGDGVIASSLVQLLCHLIPEEPFEKQELHSRVQEVAGYLIAEGLLDRIYRHSRALIETDYFQDQEHEPSLLISAFDLVSRLCSHSRRPGDPDPGPATENSNTGEQTTLETHLLASLASTEAAGAIGTLYAAVALMPQNQKGSSPTPNQTTMSQSTRVLTARGLRLLKSIAMLDIQRFQNLLGAEGTSLQWRLIASHVITRLSGDPISDKTESGSSGTHILSELFEVLGYFAVNNPENQLVLQSAGAGPSVLQQLCTLPFPFYGDPRLTSYTLPTLLAATHSNPEATAILSCELSYQLLEKYRNSEEGKLNRLVRLLKENPSP